MKKKKKEVFMLKIKASEQVVNSGIYNLSSEDYHKGPGISRSGLLEFKRSPYHYWYKYLNPEYIPEPSTPAQTFGNALHSYVLEPESFAERYFVMPKFNKQTKLGAERWQLMKLEIGKREILSEAQWQTLQAMADSLRKNKLVRQLLENAQIEKSLYWTDPDTSESLFSRKILAILSPKLVRITRLKVGPDSSCVRHALAHSRLRAVASTMTLRRDAFPASPVNARLSWALRLALLLQCSPVSSPVFYVNVVLIFYAVI
jgi:hypothetical protein